MEIVRELFYWNGGDVFSYLFFSRIYLGHEWEMGIGESAVLLMFARLTTQIKLEHWAIIFCFLSRRNLQTIYCSNLSFFKSIDSAAQPYINNCIQPSLIDKPCKCSPKSDISASIDVWLFEFSYLDKELFNKFAQFAFYFHINCVQHCTEDTAW